MPTVGSENSLSSYTDDKFRALVDDDVRGILDHQVAKLLRKSENVERWYYALVLMKKSVESQLGAKRAEVQQYVHDPSPSARSRLNDYNSWRAGALRFKNGVEAHLLEAREIIAQDTRMSHTELVKSERNFALGEMERLKTAILDHRQTVLREGFEPTAADLDLWKCVSTARTTQ